MSALPCVLLAADKEDVIVIGGIELVGDVTAEVDGGAEFVNFNFSRGCSVHC